MAFPQDVRSDADKYAADFVALHSSPWTNLTGANLFDDNAVPATIPLAPAPGRSGPHPAVHHWTMEGTGTREGQLLASGGALAAGAAFPTPAAVRTGTWRGSFRVDLWRADGTHQGGGLVVVRRTPAVTPLSVIQNKHEFVMAVLSGTQPQRIEFAGPYSRMTGTNPFTGLPQPIPHIDWNLRAGDPIGTNADWQVPLFQETYLPYGTRPRRLFGIFTYGYDTLETARLAVRAHPEITEWQIWNEPDVIGVSPEAAAAAYIAFRAMVLEENPAARVRGPAQVTINNVTWTRAFLAAGGGAGVDVIDEHLYNAGLGSIPTYRYLSLPPHRSALTDYGQHNKLYGVSEFGNYFADNYGMGTSGDQAARLLTEYFVALELGATPERLYVYKFPANGDWGQPSWLSSFPGMKYPALGMMIAAGRVLDPLDIDGTMVPFVWDGPGQHFLMGGRAHVAAGGAGVAWWKSDGGDGTFPLVLHNFPGATLTLTDADDNDTTVAAPAGPVPGTRVAQVPYSVYPIYATLPAGSTAEPGSLGFGSWLSSAGSASLTGGPLAASAVMKPTQVVRGPWKDKIVLGEPNTADGASVLQSALTPSSGSPVLFETTWPTPGVARGFFVRSGRPWQQVGTIRDATVRLLIDGEWVDVFTIAQDMPIILTGGSTEADGHASWFDNKLAWRFAWARRLATPTAGATGLQLVTRQVSRGQGPDVASKSGYGALSGYGDPVTIDSVKEGAPTLALTRVEVWGDPGSSGPVAPASSRRWLTVTA